MKDGMAVETVRLTRDLEGRCEICGTILQRPLVAVI